MGDPVRIVLLGPPGAGKGTQAQMLADGLGVVHVASGDLFRQHQAQGTEIGRLVRSYMERGELVPDWVTIEMILQRVQEQDCRCGYILDGFPRTLAQAQALDEALLKRGEAVDAALHIGVEEEELVRRLSGRLICRSCQVPYHRDTAPPKAAGVCDVCGGDLYQRGDDRPEAVRRRIQVYRAQTLPLLDYYRKQGKLREVDGQRPIEEVARSMAAAVAA